MLGWSFWFGCLVIVVNVFFLQGINVVLFDCYVVELNNIFVIFLEGLIVVFDVFVNVGDEVCLKFSINFLNNYLFVNFIIEFFLFFGV